MSKQNQRKVRFQRGGEDDNIVALAEGPQQRKSWSRHDLRNIRAQTERQSDALRAWFEGSNLALIGSAGTGKTLLACYMAASAMLDPASDINKIVVVRSAVQGRELGHLPGTVAEKMAPYEAPYSAIFGMLFNRAKTWDDLKEAHKVEFLSTSFLRGITCDNAVILLDEVQNCTFDEINTVCTRLGESSRLIVIGDTRQVDLSERYHEISGIEAMCEIVRDIEAFETVHFNVRDIVRSGFVRSWIAACESYQRRTGTEG